MRRRILSETESGVTLTLSSSSQTVTGSSGSVNIYIYSDGEALKDDGVFVSSNQTWASPTYYKSSGYFYLYYSSNTDVVNSRTAIITVTYQGQSVTFTLIQNSGDITLDWSSSIYNGYSKVIPPYVNSSRAAFNITTSYGTASDYNWSINVTWASITVSSSYVAVKGLEDYTASTTRSGTITARHKTLNKTATISVTQYGAGYISEADGGYVLCSDRNVYQLASIPSGVTPIGIKKRNSSKAFSLTAMSCSTPNTGATGLNGSLSSNPCWGGYGYSTGVSYPPYSGNSPKEATQAVLAIDNGNSTAWKTASTISTTSTSRYTHPAAQCTWRFSPAGTSQGEWYVAEDWVVYMCDMTSGNTKRTNITLIALYNKYGVNVTMWNQYNLSAVEKSANDTYYQVWTGGSYSSTNTSKQSTSYPTRAEIDI